jgi:hypothetical protein
VLIEINYFTSEPLITIHPLFHTKTIVFIRLTVQHYNTTTNPQHKSPSASTSTLSCLSSPITALSTRLPTYHHPLISTSPLSSPTLLSKRWLNSRSRPENQPLADEVHPRTHVAPHAQIVNCRVPNIVCRVRPYYGGQERPRPECARRQPVHVLWSARIDTTREGEGGIGLDAIKDSNC